MTSIRLGVITLVLSGGLLSLAPQDAHAQTKDRDLITREEIDNSAQREQDIHAVIRSLRPHFLAPPRGVRSLGNSSSKMGLYVDGVHETDFSSLKTISAATVLEVRYLDPTRSASEFGPEANGGAVIVKRMKEPPAAAPARDTTKPPHR